MTSARRVGGDGASAIGRSDAVVASLVLVVSAIAHLLYFHFSSGDFYFPDSATYLIPARNIAAGFGFLNEMFVAETMRTPGYPLFLTLFAPRFSGTEIVLTQHLLLVLLGAALYFAARRYGASVTVAVIVTLAFELDPLTVQHANKVLSESTFTCVLFLGFVLALQARVRPRPRSVLLLGFVFGVAAMIRPVGLYAIPLVSIFLFVGTSRRRTLSTLLFLLAALPLPLGWMARNVHESGVAVFSSISETNLLVHRAAPLLARDDHSRTLIEWQDALVLQADEWLQRECDCDPATLPHARRGVMFHRLAVPIIRAHIARLPGLTFDGARVNLLGSNAGAYALVTDFDEVWLEAGWSAVAFVEALLTLLALSRLARADFPLALFGALLIAYFILIAAGSEADPRFRVPVLPIMLFFCSVAAAAPETKKGGPQSALPVNRS